jgi:hypothetical protein
MAIGPAIYMGQVGSTGRSTGPHTHKELIDLKTGKRLPLSQARTDVGQNIQFRLPGSQEWQYLYSQMAPGKFDLNPAAPITSPKGMRKHPVTGQMAEHMGEDYGLPRGTDLRYLGTGSVEGIANYGNAGNIARLRTGDNRYQLDIFHLDKLPGAAKAGSSEVPKAPELPRDFVAQDKRKEEILEAFLRGTQYELNARNKKEAPENLSDYLKKQMVGQMISESLDPFSFLNSFTNDDPYMQGLSLANQQILGGYLG